MDSRIKKLAEILTDYSVKIKKGDKIRLVFDAEAKDLALEVYKNILKKGAYAITHCGIQGFGYAYYSLATDEQLKQYPELAEKEAEMSDGTIMIGAETNTREFTNIDPEKMTTRQKVTQKISDMIINQDNWVIVEYPTNALAQDAEMSLEEFEKFVYSATNVEWAEESKKQDKLKEVLDKGKQVRIMGENTDITFSIEGRQAIKCDGHRNMPDGEVFIAPVEDTTEGFIEYSYPAIRGGREVSGIKLKFEKGKVVEATAEKNQEYLLEMLETDEGAKRLGEFGVGMNSGINKFIKQILFDEKIEFTVHLALGRAYKEGGGKNESAIHWDMIKDLKVQGKILVDGQCIQENGKWLIFD